MLKPPENTDQESWHRYFAMTANNSAWSLAEQHGDPSDDQALLDAAHAAAWHWNAIGTELHRMRAMMLLANAHAIVGDGARAMDYAARMHAFFTARTDTPDWELAFAHAIHAHAAFRAGDADLHMRSYAAAEAAVARVSDAEDRAIVQKTFAQVPRPPSRA